MAVNIMMWHAVETLMACVFEGFVNTFAGSLSSGSLDGVADIAQFFGPVDIAIDSNATLFVVDALTIRRISSAGRRETGQGERGAVLEYLCWMLIRVA